MHWDPCGSLTAMTDASGSLVASFEYNKAYSRKINEHNPYGIEIPFQLDGRDGTMTATYGDATPQALVLQVHSSSRISIGNLAPILAPKVLCCYINGHGEEASCPADGGPEEECEEDSGECNCDENVMFNFSESNLDFEKGKDGRIYGSINERRKQSLRDYGFNESVVNMVSYRVGTCLSLGGVATCYPYECNGFCSMKCECTVAVEGFDLSNMDPCNTTSPF